jgi:hypothetical protein
LEKQLTSENLISEDGAKFLDSEAEAMFQLINSTLPRILVGCL